MERCDCKNSEFEYLEIQETENKKGVSHPIDESSWQTDDFPY